MGAVLFLVLFVLGALLALAGNLVSIVDAFRVSPVWGLLSLFIPFALIVFWVKFWGRKWARNGFFISLGGLGAMLLSLPFLGGFIAQRFGQVSSSVDETLIVEEIPVAPVPTPNGDAPVPDPAFAEPLVPVAPQLSPIARAELIQSTDPNERLQQINKSRTDPFSVVPTPPAPRVVAPPAPPAGGAAGTPAGTIAGNPATPGTGVPGTSTTPPGAAPGGSGGSGGSSTPPGLAPLPQLPKPTLAEAVLVTGVMTIGNENFAVVQTVNGSQYVRAGQRVSNGQVLVKRIDVRGVDPVVILEQNGIEVSRPVGGPAPGAEEQPAA
jgi:hypothetical protein